MPGVPSGKGCDGCRKQKKKCDWKGSTCSRCMRLQIPCIGGGQQRYKFMVKATDLAPRRTKARRDVISVTIEETSRSSTSSPCVYASLSNEHTLRVGAFVEKLNPMISVKYHLAWNFGDYLLEVPSRLGVNEALDAAADALVVGYTRFSSRNSIQQDTFLGKYNDALRALRMCLDDVEKAKTSETLCAVMLLLVCQMFLGGNSAAITSHAEGAAQILKFRNRPQPDDHFESKLQQTLRGPLLFESLFNDKISFTDQEWVDLVESPLDTDNVTGRMFGGFARVPSLIRRTRKALSSQINREELAIIAFDADVARRRVQPAMDFWRQRIEEYNHRDAPPGFDEAVYDELRYCTLIRLRVLALTIAIIINHISIAVSEDPFEIMDESERLTEEILSWSTFGKMYRPLGCTSLAVCSAIAWIGTRRPETKQALEALHQDFEADFYDPTATNVLLEALSTSPLMSIAVDTDHYDPFRCLST